mmetsp:Transcript_16337/g.31370  ORF Transcript_16337/g.31370 Transcript_16337/m.31370 type:complete len:216 (-) Transcript_16337:3031-3678(-)
MRIHSSNSQVTAMYEYATTDPSCVQVLGRFTGTCEGVCADAHTHALKLTMHGARTRFTFCTGASPSMIRRVMNSATALTNTPHWMKRPNRTRQRACTWGTSPPLLARAYRPGLARGTKCAGTAPDRFMEKRALIITLENNTMGMMIRTSHALSIRELFCGKAVHAQSCMPSSSGSSSAASFNSMHVVYPMHSVVASASGQPSTSLRSPQHIWDLE